MATPNSNASTLLPTRMMALAAGSPDGIECSVHTLPKPLMREFRHVFADKYLMAEGIAQDGLELLALPTNQHAIEDLVAVGEHIEREKDRLLNVVSQCYFWRVTRPLRQWLTPLYTTYRCR
jgi:hypothetical protein